tara:strand:+ start:308 stop:532 length:225 start_codon:yes stop_codon:yes gene_type:complete
MLMPEDTIAHTQTTYSICLSAATVTMFRSIDLADVTATKLEQIIANFSNLNAVRFVDYLGHYVSSSLCQKFDLD